MSTHYFESISSNHMKAFFVKEPRILADLRRPHLLEKERECRAVKTVTLSKIDYENFSFDLLVDRPFLSENAALCAEGAVWDCLFVRERGQTDGMLVIPADDASVKWAAYVKEIEV